MGNSGNYVNVNINVNGKIHKVKIQNGVGINKTDSNSEDAALRAKNGSLFCMEEKIEVRTEDDGLKWPEHTGIFTPKTTNEIKMTEAEFALFRNVADNDGDASTLSRADIEKAQNLFSQNKFTSDITKNLPSGYHGSRDAQDMINGKSVIASITNYDKSKEALAQATGKEYKSETATLRFYNKVEEDKCLEKYSKMSADGTVKRTWEGPGEGDEWTVYTYKDKDGNMISMSNDYTYWDGDKEIKATDKSPILMRVESTDSDGKHVVTAYHGDRVQCPIEDSLNELKLGYYYDQIKTSTTSDGKEMVELYDKDNNNFVLKNVVFRYKEGDKEIIEVKDENGNFSAKTADYTENGKTVHELYDKDNKMTKKTVEYEQNGKKIHEDYDGDNKITQKIVEYGEGENHVVEHYDSSNTLVKKYTDNANEYYKNGKLYKKSSWDNTEIYLNGDTCVIENGRITKIGKFNVKGTNNKELSEEAKTYREAYKNEKSKNIAKAIKDQIEGISGNAKTIAMVKAVPADQFIEVLKEYKNLDSWLWFDKASLFTELMEEWFMDENELADIGKQAFAAYMQGKDSDNVTEEDAQMANFVQSGPKGNIKDYMLKIEEYITK